MNVMDGKYSSPEQNSNKTQAHLTVLGEELCSNYCSSGDTKILRFQGSLIKIAYLGLALFMQSYSDMDILYLENSHSL